MTSTIYILITILCLQLPIKYIVDNFPIVFLIGITPFKALKSLRHKELQGREELARATIMTSRKRRE